MQGQKITSKEAAQTLGVTRQAIEYHLRKGIIPYEIGQKLGRGFERKFLLADLLLALRGRES